MVLLNERNVNPRIKVRDKRCIQRNQSQVLFVFLSEVRELLFEYNFIIK